MSTACKECPFREGINLDTFQTRHPDDGNILPVIRATGPTFVCLSDDDGGTKYNKDGSESCADELSAAVAEAIQAVREETELSQ